MAGENDRRPEAVEALVEALAAAEDSVSRLDERSRSPLGEGLNARLEIYQASSWSWNRGEVVHLEDLVLHDAGLDVRAPDQELTRTHSALRVWRRAAKVKAPVLWSARGVQGLINSRRGLRSKVVADLWASVGGRELGGWTGGSEPPDDGPAQTAASSERGFARIEDVLARAAAVTTDDDEAALEAWFELAPLIPGRWPALLQAAVLLEAWAVIDPLPRHSHMASVLADALLRRVGRLRRHRLFVEIGRRRYGSRHRRPVDGPPLTRVAWQLCAIEAGETYALEEFDRLSLARQVVSRRLAGRRSSSRLGELVDLLTASPIVTASLIAQELKVTQQAARGLVSQLGSVVVEISGRARYRAWRL